VSLLLQLVLVPLVFCLMEGVAWALHKYGMHGFLWVLHEDHHRGHRGWLEKNDSFAAFFSVLAIALFIRGVQGGINTFFFVAIGVTLYGIGYVLFHDITFHRRIRRIRVPRKGRYLKRIIRAHAAHHQKSTRYQGVSFGFLWAPRRYDVDA
jgi:beta-carotene 3-hydroxylase